MIRDSIQQQDHARQSFLPPAQYDSGGDGTVAELQRERELMERSPLVTAVPLRCCACSCAWVGGGVCGEGVRMCVYVHICVCMHVCVCVHVLCCCCVCVCVCVVMCVSVITCVLLCVCVFVCDGEREESLAACVCGCMMYLYGLAYASRPDITAVVDWV